jgi:hypothetical protein
LGIGNWEFAVKRRLNKILNKIFIMEKKFSTKFAKRSTRNAIINENLCGGCWIYKSQRARIPRKSEIKFELTN